MHHFRRFGVAASIIILVGSLSKAIYDMMEDRRIDMEIRKETDGDRGD